MIISNSKTWPQGSACAVLVTANFDAESLDLQHVERENLCGRFLYGRYGMRAGLWRLLSLLRERAVHATFFVPAADAEAYPAQVEAVVEAGHEIAARGLAFEDHSKLADGEFDVLERSHRLLERIAGAAPVGWRAPKGVLSPETLGHLGRLGYLYDSSFQDDDLPYVMRCKSGAEIVELPTHPMLEDATFFGAHHTHARLLKAWKEEFDAHYEVGALVNLTLHVRGDIGSTRASRIAIVGEFLDYVTGRPGVRFMTCRELALWWKSNHPASEEAPV